MIITREAKLYPTVKQVITMDALLEQSRLLYNKSLEIKKTAWEDHKQNISRFELQKIIKGQYDLPATVRQMTVYRLNNAYQRFFKRGGFPRFKKQGRYRSIPLRQYGTDYKISGKYLISWKKFGLDGIKTRGLQALNNPNEARIVKRASGWYLQVCDEVEVKKPKVRGCVGLDVGLKYFCVDSNGKQTDNPKCFRDSEKLLTIQQRKATKKKRGSNRKKKAYRIVAKTQERIANRRRDFLHKTARFYADNFNKVVVEDLNVKGMVKNHHLSKSISDASWSIFFHYLNYKLKMLDGELVKVKPHYTSQKCSNCGEVVPKSLSVRTHKCCFCGLSLCRDHNAAINILALGEGIVENTALAGSVKRRTPIL